jgi:hypothetical protein
MSSVKFPQPLMVFAAIGTGLKLDPLQVDGTIDADRHVRNLDWLGFIEALDAKHGPFG